MLELSSISPYELIIAIQLPGTAAFVLDRAGYGRVEDRNDFFGIALMIASIPVTLIGGFVMLGAIAWALVVLSFGKVLALILLCQLFWGSICQYLLGLADAKGWEHLIYRAGVPLVFFLRLCTAIATVLLLIQLWRL